MIIIVNVKIVKNVIQRNANKGECYEKILLLLITILVVMNLFGCASIESYKKNGDFKKAYQCAKTDEEKEKIKKENELVLLIKNCSYIRNKLDDNVDVMQYKKVNHGNIKYIIGIAKKNELKDGYFQNEYINLNSGGGYLTSFYQNDISRLEETNYTSSDYLEACDIFNDVIGEKNKYSYSFKRRGIEPVNEIQNDIDWIFSIYNYDNSLDDASNISIHTKDLIHQLIKTGRIDKVEKCY